MTVNLKDVLAKKRDPKAVLRKLKQKLGASELNISDLELRIKYRRLHKKLNTIFDSILSVDENVDKVIDEKIINCNPRK